MVINLAGKQRIRGRSAKNGGKDYDFIIAHYLGRALGVEGLAAQTIYLDPKKFSYDELIVGDQYNVEHDASGKLLEFIHLNPNDKSMTR